MSHSPSPAPPVASASTSRHATSAVEKQRQQLERLLKDPTKPAYIPPPPKEKVIRPARDMMKNVQGSSAGAGSGEFHVYKASRRREYERLKLLSEEAEKESVVEEFEERKRQREEEAEARTAKKRAQRQKKKARAKAGKARGSKEGKPDVVEGTEPPLKKKRLVNGAEVVFKRPGEEGSDDSDEDDIGPVPPNISAPVGDGDEGAENIAIPVVNGPKITIVDDD